MISPGGRTAYIDESHYEDPRYGYFYMMTAAIIDHACKPSYDLMMAELRSIARRQSDHEIHAYVMAQDFQRQSDLDHATDSIAKCDAVRALVTVRSYVSKVRTQTQARQVCLADLAVRVQQSGSVDLIKLDSLDDLGNSLQSSHPRPGSKNAVDIGKLHALQENGELDPATKLFHANSRTTSQLWIPDVVGYVTGRSIARRDPGYMRHIAPKVELHEALTLPVAMRTSGKSSLAPSGISVALSQHLARSLACNQRDG